MKNINTKLKLVISVFALLTVILFLSTSFCLAQEFKYVTWGATKSEVINSKSVHHLEEHSEKGNRVLFLTELEGIESILGYVFDEEHLFQFAYMFIEEHNDFNQYLTDYENISDKVKKAYGKPFDEFYEWEQDSPKYKDSEKLQAVIDGNLSYTSKWQTETDNIILHLYGTDGEIRHMLLFMDRDKMD